MACVDAIAVVKSLDRVGVARQEVTQLFARTEPERAADMEMRIEKASRELLRRGRVCQDAVAIMMLPGGPYKL